MVVFIGGGASAKLLATVALPTDNAFSPVNDGGGQGGELMVIVAGGLDLGGNLARNVPSGWIEFLDGVSSISSFTNGINILYRKLNGSETGDIMPFTGDSVVITGGVAHRFRWNDTPTDADIAGQVTTGNPSAQTVNASGQTAPVLVIGASMGGTDGTISLSLSPTETYDSGALKVSSVDLRVKHLLYPEGSAPADVTVDMDDEGSNILTSGYLVNS